MGLPRKKRLDCAFDSIWSDKDELILIILNHAASSVANVGCISGRLKLYQPVLWYAIHVAKCTPLVVRGNGEEEIAI
jgi:hypothetical protein